MKYLSHVERNADSGADPTEPAHGLIWLENAFVRPEEGEFDEKPGRRGDDNGDEQPLRNNVLESFSRGKPRDSIYLSENDHLRSGYVPQVDTETEGHRFERQSRECY